MGHWHAQSLLNNCAILFLFDTFPFYLFYMSRMIIIYLSHEKMFSRERNVEKFLKVPYIYVWKLSDT